MKWHRLLSICTVLLAGYVLITGCGPRSIPSPTALPTSPPEATSTPDSTPASPPHSLPVIFDDDGSPDGTTALFYLLSHPDVSVEAIGISYGEAYPDVYIQHIGRKLDSLGIQNVPLGAGQSAPLAGNNSFPEALRQGANNFWGLPIPNADRTYPAQNAADLMMSVVNQSPVPVTIFVSGPLTNLAQALRMDPGIGKNIAAVYIMGGAVYVPGNISDLLPDTDNTVAEWNIYADPLAAKEVFEAGLDLYLVPLDATNQVTISRDDTAHWREGGGAADFAADIYDMLLNNWGVQEAAIWDLMTAAIMVKPELCGFDPLRLEVITGEGPTSGQTVPVATGEPNAQVCLRPDASQIKQTLIDVFSSSLR